MASRTFFGEGVLDSVFRAAKNYEPLKLRAANPKISGSQFHFSPVTSSFREIKLA
jgi:hypothetical protein